MKKISFAFVLAAICSLLLMVGCRKDKNTISMAFNAHIEAPDGDQKTFLFNEKWISWDQNDAISVAPSLASQAPHDHSSGKACKGVLTIGSGVQQGTFQVNDVDEDGGYGTFLALYPYKSTNMIAYNGSAFTATLDFPATQAYRNDFSFGHDACPMVGYTDDLNLEFHSLCAIARVGLYSSATASKAAGDNTIKNITFTVTGVTVNSTNTVKPTKISGMFNVRDFITAAPYLEAVDATPTPAEQQIVIDCQDVATTNPSWVTLGTGDTGLLRSFYLTLPALSSNYTTYHLTMTVTNINDKCFTKSMTIKTRRKAITKLPAIEITEWSASPGTGTGVVGIVGNGTQLRPFQIYDINDLTKVRAAFNAVTPPAKAHINGIPVDGDTYFQVMRSDILLTTANWTEGIRNFSGHFIYGASTSNPGITNNSSRPLFESITEDGIVKGITMKGAMTTDAARPYMSMLCHTNNGTISECIAASGASVTCSYSNSRPLEEGGAASLCVYNNGTISGCYSMANVSAPAHIIGGIVLFNQSGKTVSNCHMDGQMQGASSSGGAICYKNEGTVQSCYAAMSYSTACNLGGIVFKNVSSGTVQSCFLTNSSNVTTTGSFGGIVNDNQGTVDYCYNAANTINVGNTAGGIVSNNYSATGVVTNCWVNANLIFHQNSSTAYIGGLVGLISGGEVSNSYSRAIITSAGTNKIGFALGEVTGGAIDNCYCTNGTYTTEANFYASYSVGSVGVSHPCYGYNHNVSETYVKINSFSLNSSGIPMTSAGLLLDKLNEGRGSGHTWVEGSGHYPVLSSETAKSKRGASQKNTVR